MEIKLSSGAVLVPPTEEIAQELLDNGATIVETKKAPEKKATAKKSEK